MQALQEVLAQIARLFVWLVIVAPWEQALRVRLGRNVKLLPAGTYLAVPFIDRIYRQTIRRRLALVAPQTLTTTDHRAVTVGSAIGYSIGDLRKLYETLHDAEDTIEASAAALVSQYVSANKFDDCHPAAIEAHVRARLKLDEFGLVGAEFYITNFAAVKTYRLVTGEISRQWARGGGFNTTVAESPTAR